MGKKAIVEALLSVGDKVMYKGMGPLTVIHVDEEKVEAISMHLRVTVFNFDKAKFDRVEDGL